MQIRHYINIVVLNHRSEIMLNFTKIAKNINTLTNIGISIHLFTAELLSALAWHSKSSGKISKNGISLPVCGSIHVFLRARYKYAHVKEKAKNFYIKFRFNKKANGNYIFLLVLYRESATYLNHFFEFFVSQAVQM